MKKALIMLLLVVAGCAPQTDKAAEELQAKHYFKKFPVLEYHLIQRPEARWSRTPENFRGDLEWLYDHGYYPMNLRDILTGFKGLPEGKTPAILTFDDSSSGQFRYLKDGTIDPECAVGILKAFHEEHKDEWPMRGTFFVLIGTNNPDRNIFGQPERPEYKEKKLRQLTEWGMEVGSHTYWHDRLDRISPAAARYTLAKSYEKLKGMSGQEIVSIALPMGLYPKDMSVFSGEYQSIAYDYKLACEVAGGLSPSPWEKGFDPLRINRIQALDEEWEKFFLRGRRANNTYTYLRGAELQYENEEQKGVIIGALNDMLKLPPSALKAKRYPDYRGNPGRWDLRTFLERHFVPDRKVKKLTESVYGDTTPFLFKEYIRELLASIEA